jgi:hypothetical protein
MTHHAGSQDAVLKPNKKFVATRYNISYVPRPPVVPRPSRDEITDPGPGVVCHLAGNWKLAFMSPESASCTEANMALKLVFQMMHTSLSVCVKL